MNITDSEAVSIIMQTHMDWEKPAAIAAEERLKKTKRDPQERIPKACFKTKKFLHY